MASKYWLLKSDLTWIPTIHLKEQGWNQNLPIMWPSHIKDDRLFTYEMHGMQQRLVLEMWWSLSKKWNAPMQSSVMDELSMSSKSMYIMVLLFPLSAEDFDDDIFIGLTWSIQGHFCTFSCYCSISIISFSLLIIRVFWLRWWKVTAVEEIV